MEARRPPTHPAPPGMKRLSWIDIALVAFQPESRSTMDKRLIAPKAFQSGQVWELADSSVQIGLVGKTLVHYKHYKIKQPRVPTSLISKVKLEKFLNENRAVLVQE
jgi:hypothetical protein